MNLAPVQCLYVGIYEYFRQIFAPACPKEMSEMTDCNAPQLQMPHSFTDIYCSIGIGYSPTFPSRNSDLISEIHCIPPFSPPRHASALSDHPTFFLLSFLSPDGQTDGRRARRRR